LTKDKINYPFHLKKKNINESLGIFNLTEFKNKHFKSPIAGSFGAIEFSSELPIDIKINFIEKVLDFITTELKPRIIEVVLSPDIYNLEDNSFSLNTFFRKKFIIDRIETNQYIDLRKYRLERDVSYGNRKRIKNSINKGIQFSKLEKIDYFRAFKVIVDNRARRGFPLTMKWESLEEMISAFNDKLYFFGLQEKKEIIASAICINVFPNLLYVFYWGEISGYEKLSPIALLSNKLVEYCIKNNFEILDIGTSSERSNPNIGLLKFKKNIGCNTCNKFYLKKNL
ncbi:MAG: hypothetical protein CL869_01845, partial [Cytophagia bacterium]|nr:hypothetical protein [Cytophagia bacterium]